MPAMAPPPTVTLGDKPRAQASTPVTKEGGTRESDVVRCSTGIGSGASLVEPLIRLSAERRHSLELTEWKALFDDLPNRKKKN